MYNRLRLGEILIKNGHASAPQVQQALKVQLEQQPDHRLGRLLVAMGVCSGQDVAQALAEQLDYPYLEAIDTDAIDLHLLEPLQLGFCRENRILPLRRDTHHILVATEDPLNVQVLDELRLVLGEEVVPTVVAPGMLTEAINSAFELKSRQLGAGFDSAFDEAEKVNTVEEVSLDKDLLEAADDDEAPVIRFVNSLFVQAVRERASDIHIEPGEKEIRVRFRVDGVLKAVASPPKRFHGSIITRIKILSDLDIAQKRIPQDGRIRIRIAGKDIDIRVATAPAAHGERVTMRLLDKSAVLLNLRDIGFLPDQLGELLKLVRKPHGIILVTGPTGSGKTTTLYSCLSEINSPDKNIMTVEDPVEYQLDGISQMQVQPKIDLTFATGLRSYLRHDPDVIMVGEIRDTETAEMAIQASLTGHLVFSTLHTNDAAGAFTRLTDMGVEPFLVSSTLIASLAQRLVRRLCSHCKEVYHPTEEELSEIGLSSLELHQQTDQGHIYKPREGGCEECNGLGYRGRTGIYELLMVDDSVKKLVMNRMDSGTIKKEAGRQGMRSLRDDGAIKVLRGLTSIEEILRVTSEGLEEPPDLAV